MNENFDETAIPTFDGYSFQNRESQLQLLAEQMNKLVVPAPGGKNQPIYIAALGWGSGKTQLFTRGVAAHLAQQQTSAPKDFDCIHCYYDGQAAHKEGIFNHMLSGKSQDNVVKVSPNYQARVAFFHSPLLQRKF